MVNHVKISAYLGNRHIDLYSSNGEKKTFFDSSDKLIIKGIRAGETIDFKIFRGNKNSQF